MSGGTAAARYQQQHSHQQQLMQKLHGGSSAVGHGSSNNGGGGVPPGPNNHPHHPFYGGPPQSPAGYPPFGPGPPPGSGFGGPNGPNHPSPGIHHTASGLTNGGGPGQGPPFSNPNHMGPPGQGHQQHGHQMNGHHGSHPSQHNNMANNAQHAHMNGLNQNQQNQPQPTPTFAGSDSSFARQQMQYAIQSRGSTAAHHHARAAHLTTRSLATTGNGNTAAADPSRHPVMQIGRPNKDGKEKDGVNGSQKKPESEAGRYTRHTSLSTLRRIGAPGSDSNASPSAKELNTAVIIEAEREKIGLPWTTLDMGGMNLRNISIDLLRFSFLTTLYVPHNQLTTLPTILASLSHLILLDASGNKITSIPGDLGMLTNLRELLLFDNQLTTLPPELGTLHQLDLLGIEGNPLQDNLRSLMEKEGTSGLIAYLRDSCPVPLPPPDREWITVETDSFPTGADANAPEPERFSVLSFNILCEKYATSTMYGYTPSWALAWDYRKELILQELVGYGADILCLQEVECEQYEEFFLHHLSQQGYDGVFFPKSRARTMSHEEKKHVDGGAIFYKESTFSLVEQQVVEFNQVAMRRTDFKKTEDMFNRVMRRDDVAVLALLEHKLSGSRLIVANVHTYWDPDYRDVKLVQVAMMMDEITKTADHFARLPPRMNLGKGYEKAPTYSEGKNIPLLVCGDFNSVPDSGVYDFLANGSAPGNHEDFMNHIYGTYTSEGISHKFSLKSSYANLDTSVDHPTGGLNLTNYVPGFRGVIDYIWYNSSALSVTGLLGEIEQSYLNKVVGFPNAHFPSDHISILAEFKVKPQTEDSPAQPRKFKPTFHSHR